MKSEDSTGTDILLFSRKLKLGFASGVKSVISKKLQILSISDFKNLSTPQGDKFTSFAPLQHNKNQKYWKLSNPQGDTFYTSSIWHKSEILKRRKIIRPSENQKILQNSSTKFLLIFFINFQNSKKSVKKWHFFKDNGT